MKVSVNCRNSCSKTHNGPLNPPPLPYKPDKFYLRMQTNKNERKTNKKMES